MILRDGLLGTQDYPGDAPVLTPPVRPTPIPFDEASAEEWDKARRLWRRLGFVATPMPDGTVIPADKVAPVLDAMRATLSPPAPRKPEPPRLPVVTQPVDYKARASGERDDEPEPDVPF